MRKLFQNREQLKTVIKNTGLLVGDKVIRYGLGFALGAGIARYLGPEQYGVLSYVLSLVAILVPLIGNGLDNVIVREMVNSPESIYDTLGTATFIRAAGALLTTVSCGLAVNFLRPGNEELLVLVVLMASATFPLAADIIELWFQSRLLSKYPIIGKGVAFLLVSAWKVYMIVTHASVETIIIAGVVENILGALGLVYFFHREGMHVRLFRLRKILLGKLFVDGWAVVLSGVAGIVAIRLDQVIIEMYMGDSAVGIYSAAFRFSEFAFALPALVSVSVLPVLVDSYKTNEELYNSRVSLFLQLMTLSSIVLSLLVLATSGTIIPLFFGPAFAESSKVLSIQIWSCVFVFMQIASNQHLIVQRRAELCFYRTIASAVVSILLNFVLIPRHGLVGAAVSCVVSNAVGVFSVAFFPGMARHSKDLLNSFRLDSTVYRCVNILKSASRG